MAGYRVGTGGAASYQFGTPRPDSEARGLSRGVLKLMLRDVGYDWECVPIGPGSADGAAIRARSRTVWRDGTP